MDKYKSFSMQILLLFMISLSLTWYLFTSVLQFLTQWHFCLPPLNVYALWTFIKFFTSQSTYQNHCFLIMDQFLFKCSPPHHLLQNFLDDLWILLIIYFFSDHNTTMELKYIRVWTREIYMNNKFTATHISCRIVFIR